LSRNSSRDGVDNYLGCNLGAGISREWHEVNERDYLVWFGVKENRFGMGIWRGRHKDDVLEVRQ